MKKLKELYNNFKKYYNNNKPDVLILLGLWFGIILLVIALGPIMSHNGMPPPKTIELFMIFFVGILLSSVFL